MSEKKPPFDPRQGQHAENIVQTALAAGMELAPQVITNPITDGKPFVALQDADGSTKLHFLTERFEAPARKRGNVKLNDVDSFLGYWSKHVEVHSAVYGSIDPGQFTAVFDEHSDIVAGHREHRAHFKLTHSLEWLTWAKMNGQPFGGNEQLAIWLENQAPDIVEPSGASMVEIALNFRVNANAAYSNNVSLVNGKAEFAYTNIVEGESKTGAGGKIAIPEHFVIEIPVFAGIGAAKYRVEARFRYRLVSSKLALWYELVRPHRVVEAAFKAILDKIEASTDTPVLFGEP